jgi:hypothetical protein
MKPKNPRAEGLSAEIGSLATLSRELLQERWRELYCTETPRKIGYDLLIRAIA